MARKRGRGMAACWYGIARTAVIDRAAALQKRASPGEVLVGAETAAAALVELRDLQPVPDAPAGQTAFLWKS